MNSLCDRTTLARSLPLSNHYTAMLLGYYQNTVSRTYSDVIMPSYIYITIRRGCWRTHKRIMDSSRRLPWGIRCTCIFLMQYTYIYVDTPGPRVLHIIWTHVRCRIKGESLTFLAVLWTWRCLILTQTKLKKVDL